MRPVAAQEDARLETVVQYIENRTFEEMHVGDTAELTRTLGPQDMDVAGEGQSAAYGVWSTDFIHELLSTRLPGPGTVYLDLSLHFRNAAAAGDTVTARIRIRDMVPETRQVTLGCECVAASGELLIEGQARVAAPSIKLRRPRALEAAPVLFAAGTRYWQLLDAARRFDPIRTAIVHPCDAVSIASAMEAKEARLIVTILVGPAAKIRRAAADSGQDLEGVEIVDVPHSHAAAERAVALGREAKVEALMKGRFTPMS